MSIQTLHLSILASAMTISINPDPNALASIEFNTHYAFDANTVAKVLVVDDKSATKSSDPLHNLIFKISFSDKVDGSVITDLQGRLYTGGGIEALEENHSSEFGYISSKLDFYGALDREYDFFESIITTYNPSQAQAIQSALAANNVLNAMGDYRIKDKQIAVPATDVTDLTPLQIKNCLLNMGERPRYLSTCETDSLPTVEALAEVTNKLNAHLIVDVGDIKEWQAVVAIAEAINLNDHRAWLFWNPNKSRPGDAQSLLSRKKWRPCIGDYLAQLMIRNAGSNAKGIPPINRPVAGYDFPLSFRDIEKFDGLTLDEEAQNALASAGVNVVINERFEGGDRWIYGDAITQYNSANSALRLINASEITTYTENVVISIVKKHLLKAMSSFIRDATDECVRFLDACADAGLITISSELGGRYYALNITPRADDPFTKADVKLSRRPQGCARQVFLETTVTK